MPKLPQISGRELTKAFFRNGWFQVSQKGNHLKLRKIFKPGGQRTVIIPQHKTLKKGTLSGILKDSDMTLEKLINLL